MKKELFRLRIAHWLNKHFEHHFCWAGLVSWAYSSGPFWKIVHEWGDNRGCKKEGEETACYCGKYANPDYYKQ